MTRRTPKMAVKQVLLCIAIVGGACDGSGAAESGDDVGDPDVMGSTTTGGGEGITSGSAASTTSGSGSGLEATTGDSAESSADVTEDTGVEDDAEASDDGSPEDGSTGVAEVDTEEGSTGAAEPDPTPGASSLWLGFRGMNSALLIDMHEPTRT